MDDRSEQDGFAWSDDRAPAPPLQRPAEWQTGTSHLYRRRRVLRVCMWLLIPALVTWVAPLIVAHSPLRQHLIDQALEGRLKGRLVCSGASFGWLSPIRLYNLELTNPDGQALATVESVATGRTLVGLALHRSDPGTIVVQRPSLRLELRRDGSNLEDVLAPLLSGRSSGGNLPLGVEVHEGQIEIVETSSERTWHLEGLDASVQTPAGPEQPLTLAVRGHLTTRESTNGLFDGSLQWRAPASGQMGLGEGDVTLQTEGLPIDVAAPLLRRFVGPLQLDGTITLDGRYAWSDNPGKLDGSTSDPAAEPSREPPQNEAEADVAKIDAAPGLLRVAQRLELRELAANHLHIAAPRWLGATVLRAPAFKARGDLRVARGRCELRGWELESPLARIQAEGGVPIDALRGGNVQTALFSALRNEDVTFHGELDLTQLASAFPEIVRVRSDTEITDGKMVFDFVSRLQDDLRHWEGRVESTNLTADHEGRRITWEQPLQAAISIRHSAAGLVVDKLVCQSSFLQAEARGQASDGELNLQSDLTQLHQELERFLSLGDTRLAGKLRADLTWKRASDRRLTARGEVRMDQFECVVGTTRPWRESELTATLAVSGFGSPDGIGRLDNASLRVEAGGDHLQFDLTDAVSNVTRDTAWPVRGRIVGDLARWLPRIQPILPLDGWTVAGNVDATVDARLHPGGVGVTAAKIDVANLQVDGEGTRIREPQLKIDGAGSWDRTRQQVQMRGLTCASSTLAFRADDVALHVANGKWAVAANVGFRTDLTRLAACLDDPRAPRSWQLAGMATGQLKVGTTAGATTARWGIDLDNLALATATVRPSSATAPGAAAGPAAPAREFTPAWEEPKLRLNGQATYDALQDVIRLTTAEADCAAFKLAAAGTITDPTSRCTVVVDGNVTYDLQEFTRRLRAKLGPAVEFQGRDTRPFRLRGPIRQLTIAESGPDNVQFVNVPSAATTARSNLWPPVEFSGQAGLAWSSGYAYGLPMGPGQIEARLEQGVLEVKPVDLDVAEGKLHLAPKVLLHRPDMLMTADKGPVLEQVRISPTMCALWLKYVLPVVADVADAEGKFSADLLNAAAVPLADPLNGEVHGKMTVHSVQIGPGPMARELLSLAQLVKSIADGRPLPQEVGPQRVWLQLPQQEVPFHFKERRVYHQNLTVTVKDVALVTSGSVGLDHSLDMLAEIPIRDEWVANNRYLTSLRGQKIQVPITGTLTAPRVDRRTLQQIATQTLTNSAGKVFEQELNRGLDRLLRPRPSQPPPTTRPQQ